MLGAKQSDHTFLFDWVAASERTTEASFSEENGFRNGVPLNDANFDLEVNFLASWEHAPDSSWRFCSIRHNSAAAGCFKPP
jgi:hypothetical protein